MKVLVLNIEFPPVGGGASPVCHEIARRMVLRGHRVTVLTMHYKDLPVTETVDGIQIVRLHCSRKKIDMSYLREHILYIIRVKQFLKKHLDKRSYDICHAHFLLPCGIIAKWIKRKFQIPYIVTSHGSDVPNYNPDRFKLLHHFTPRLIRSIINNSSGITSPSKYLLELIKKIWNENPEKLYNIPNGIDSEAYRSATKKRIILSTGRLVRRKGFHLLIQAVSFLDSDFELHICGEGPMMNELKKLAKKSTTKVVFHGWLNNQSPEYRNLLAECSIYSLVSERENASIALLEAMSSGCAIITSDSHGCVEMIDDCGICIQPGDGFILKTTIEKLIQNPAMIDSLGLKALSRIESRFDWDRIMDRYEDLCHSVIETIQS